MRLLSGRRICELGRVAHDDAVLKGMLKHNRYKEKSANIGQCQRQHPTNFPACFCITNLRTIAIQQIAPRAIAGDTK